MRLIDADALFAETEKTIKANHECRMAVVDDEFLDLINDADTIDAVEVVRCKDCKKCESYYPAKKEGEEPYPLLYECKRNRGCVLPTHFCGYGERREV